MRRFVKVQGLGNDFVLLDHRQGGVEVTAAQARRWCDRRRGIGADGVLTVWPDDEALARMQVHNADGSEAETCGNGLRCVARHLFERGAWRSEPVTLRSGQGLHRVWRVTADRYRVTMGRALGRHPDLPAAGPDGTVTLAVGGEARQVVPVQLGNPHAVVISDQPVRDTAERFGAALERHPAFPRRANASFVRPIAEGFEAAVFERGVGLTEACGSAACAIGAAAVRLGLWREGQPMQVVMPGGILTIAVDPDGEVSQEGEAVVVFSGEVDE